MGTEVKKFHDVCMYVIERYMPESVTKVIVREYLNKAGPAYTMEAVGPFCWRYRSQIETGDIKFFAQHDYAEQIAVWRNIPILSTVAERIRDIIRSTACNVDANGIACARSMLSFYAQYVLNQRRIV